MRSREITLARHPQGLPVAEDFETITVDLPAPGPGQVLVENVYLSVDPYMRGRMTGVRSYIAPFDLDRTLTGGAVGRVVQSESAALSPGQLVVHDAGWRTAAVLDETACRPVTPPEGVSASLYLGLLGMPGLTAYVGLRDIGALRPGDRVYVSAASGAVGRAVGQFASLMGAGRVVGSAGSAEKASGLLADGFDAAFDYHAGPLPYLLKQHCRDGIDLYFDNVGGDQLQAAWSAMRDFGRVVVCGVISQYNSAPGQLSNMALAIVRRLTVRGFVVFDHEAARPDFEADVGRWLAEGRVRAQETFFEGIDNTVAAFQSLFTGEKLGKVIVRISA